MFGRQTMSTRGPKHIDAAKRLLAHASNASNQEGNLAAAAGRVHENVFGVLSPIIGGNGVRALFARSVRLSVAEFPSLQAMQGNAHAVDQGAQLVACLAELDADAASEVAVGLFANFLGLMSNFIGERMVWQIVGSAFPAIDMSGLKEQE